jgi:hypothetical protein
MKVIHIYSQRWRVEDYHKAWKTGAGAERQRMTEPENLERMVSILAFVGVRLMQLRESLTLAVQLKARGSLEQAEAIGDERDLKTATIEMRVKYRVPRESSERGFCLALKCF